MKKRITSFALAVLTLLGALSASACGKQPDGQSIAGPVVSAAGSPADMEPNSSQGSVGSGTPSAAQAAHGASRVVNPLTGQEGFPEDAAGRRPLGVMINNIRAATPQHNIAAADLCYEMQAEGGITRILALYSDWEALPMTGSIRSARPYFVELARGHDCIYVHVGGSEDALDAIRSSGLDSVNGVSDSVTIWRDAGRKESMGSVHSCVTDGEKLGQCVRKRNIRTVAKSSGTAFSFRPDGEAQPPQGQACTTLTVPFSSYVTSRFIYDPKDAVYAKYQFGKGQMDAATGEQVEVTNVLVLRAPIAPTGDSLGHVTIQLDGGKGMYASMGRCQDITWSRQSDTKPIALFDASGEALSLNPGKTWVCIVGLKDHVTVE